MKRAGVTILRNQKRQPCPTTPRQTTFFENLVIASRSDPYSACYLARSAASSSTPPPLFSPALSTYDPDMTTITAEDDNRNE